MLASRFTRLGEHQMRVLEHASEHIRPVERAANENALRRIAFVQRQTARVVPVGGHLGA